MEELIRNPLFNKSEIARQLGITSGALNLKVAGYTKYPYARLTKEQRMRLKELFIKLRREIEISLADEKV